MISPPSFLYDKNYYETSCEGYEYNLDNLSPRLKHFQTWVTPQWNDKSGLRILDVGFGRGELSILSARHRKVSSVVSVDYSYDAAQIFTEKLKSEDTSIQKKILPVIGNIGEVLPIIGRFDAIIAFDVIEHIYRHHITHLLNMMSNKLSVGSKIYVVTPLSSEPPNERHVWLAKTPDDLFSLLPSKYEGIHIGATGSGEDHMFEFVRV